MERQAVTVREAADRLGIGVTQILGLLVRGQLRWTIVYEGGRECRLLTLADVLAALEGRSGQDSRAERAGDGGN